MGYSGDVRVPWKAAVSAVLATGIAVAAFWVGGEDRREGIRVEENRVVVTNLGKSDWSNVEVWVNGWYRAQAPRVLAGQRLDVPFTAFAAGFDRRYNPARQPPFGVEVTARAADGTAIRLAWGQVRRR